MRSIFSCHCVRHSAAVLAASLSLGVLAGCVTSHRAPENASVRKTASEPTPVIRYGRYTLVELAPDAAQRDLMLQVIDITVPAMANDSVGEAVRYVLLRSGYQLCDDRDETRALDTLPLPAAHNHLGPITLHDALQTLVGPAWDLQVDDADRRVCFARRNTAPVGHK